MNPEYKLWKSWFMCKSTHRFHEWGWQCAKAKNPIDFMSCGCHLTFRACCTWTCSVLQPGFLFRGLVQPSRFSGENCRVEKLMLTSTHFKSKQDTKAYIGIWTDRKIWKIVKKCNGCWADITVGMLQEGGESFRKTRRGWQVWSKTF